MPIPVVPIKVKIGLRPNGHADHPAWERMSLVAAELPASPSRERIDEEVRKSVVGSWYYDKQSGHQVETSDSARGMQWGMLLVLKPFADAAVATFPALVTVMTQAECAAFWDTRVFAHRPEEEVDLERLQALKLQRDLLKDLKKADSAPEIVLVDARIAKALDPLDPAPGVKKNLLRFWADAQGLLGVLFDPSVPP